MGITLRSFWHNSIGRRETLTYVNAGHNPPMLIRGSLDSQRTAGELLQATGIDRSLLIRSMETNHRFAAAVAEEPGIRLLTRGGPIIGTFLDGPYEQETIRCRAAATSW